MHQAASRRGSEWGGDGDGDGDVLAGLELVEQLNQVLNAEVLDIELHDDNQVRGGVVWSRS